MKVYRRGTQLICRLDRHFRDFRCFAQLGTLKYEFDRAPAAHAVVVDFADVEWADPLPLLSLSALLRQMSHVATEIHVEFGRFSPTSEHLILLKFMANQGFVDLLGKTPNSRLLFRDEEDRRSIEYQVDELRQRLGSFHQDTHYQNADCILAKLLPVQELRTGRKTLQTAVEELVREADRRAIYSAFGSEPISRDRLLQKLRRLLLELIDNAVEHAYDHQEEGCVGIYARIRGARPVESSLAERWDGLLQRERLECPTLSRFEPNPAALWLEVFVCDTGRGLLHDMRKWRVPPNNPKLAKLLRRASANRNPLQATSRLLFQEPLSRHDREGSPRTTVTGLQYLGRVLGIDRDFARIYTNHEWAGSTHPWNPESINNFRTSRDSEEFAGKRAAPGTCYAISIQPEGASVQYPEKDWIVVGDTGREQIIAALAEPPLHEYPPEITFYDRRRREDTCAVPEEWKTGPLSEEGSHPPVVILRPPRSVTKRDFGAWLQAVAGLPAVPASRPAAIFIIAELTPFQAMTYSDFFQRVRLNAGHSLQLFLVAEDWAVCCLSRDPTNRYRLAPDLATAQAFLDHANHTLGCTAALVARILRRADSRIFWLDKAGQPKLSDVFVHGRIRWCETNERPGDFPDFIDGYLDLTQALVDPDCYRACRRALRRFFALFPALEPLATDVLVESLIEDATRGLYRHDGWPRRPKNRVAVGSVRVTSSTVNRFRTRTDLAVEREVYLFIHPSSGHTDPDAGHIALMDWTPPPAVLPPVDDLYHRIPGSPFIGEHGERAISLTRFWPRDQNGKEFATSYYGRTPDQTYTDFQRLGALKLGHWTYGTKHDLLTINLSRAFELSCLDHGPMIEWLEQQLYLLFDPSRSTDGKARACVLVYPSHAVTDQIIAHFQGDDRRSRLLPWAGVFPVKFLGAKTVSPFRASPLVSKRMSDAIRSALSGDHGNRAHAGVVILDDGSLSGKILREMTQLLQSLGANTVDTLILLDRTGLPIHDDVMKRVLARHHRLWRWDVPTLGHERSCTLCAAIGRTTAMSVHIYSPSARTRLREWSALWKPVPVNSEWDKAGLTSQPFKEPIRKRFGIFRQDDGYDTCHYVTHGNSTSFAAMAAEITRQTTRSDWALRKSEQLGVAEGPQAAIEILCSQLLLYLDELSYWERRDRFWALLSLLFRSENDTPATALAGICLALVGDDMVVDIWDNCKAELLRQKRLQTTDARLGLLILKVVRERVAPDIPDRMSDQPTEAERYNYLLLDTERGFKKELAKLLELIGTDGGPAHVSDLMRYLRHLMDSAVTTASEAERHISTICLLLDRLTDTLQGLHAGKYLLDARLPPDPAGDAHAIVEQRECKPSPNQMDILIAAKDWATHLSSLVFGDDTRNECIAKNYWRCFTIRITEGKQIAALLDAARPRLLGEWPRIVAEKQQRHEHIASRWTTHNAGGRLAEIRCGDGGVWRTSQTVYYDFLVEQCIVEILSNCLHAPATIGHPWSTDTGYLQQQADVWWRARIRYGHLFIWFANACATERVPFKRGSLAIAGVERVGGRIKARVREVKGQDQGNVGSYRLAVTTLMLPTLATLLRPERQR